MENNLIFKACFIIYRFILILSIPLIFLAELLVGFGGHGSNPKKTNYLFFAFAIITSFLLTVFSQTDLNKFKLKKTLRLSVIILVLISIIYEIYGLFELNQASKYGTGEIIFLSAFILFTIVSLILLYGLLRDKI